MSDLVNNPITNYWYENYVHDGHCSLCGQVGLIDTRSAVTPAGFFCGRVNFCICPNGQQLREKAEDGPTRVLELYRQQTNNRIRRAC